MCVFAEASVFCTMVMILFSGIRDIEDLTSSFLTVKVLLDDYLC